MKKLLTACLLLAALLGLFPACAPQNTAGVAIYLTAQDIPPAQMEALSHLNLAAEPLVAPADILSYNSQTFSLQLSESAYRRLLELQVPTRGLSFVVCRDGSPLFWGAFWALYSSQSFSGVTIWQPLRENADHRVTLELGYPSAAFSSGEDPRRQPAFLEALEQAGKLRDELVIAEIPRLPGSLTGYELYSWPEGGECRYTLISGTERTKTAAEITTGENYISDSGFLKIQAADRAELELLLSKLPVGQMLVWRSGPLPAGDGTDRDFSRPPDTTVQAIRQQALDCELNLILSP